MTGVPDLLIEIFISIDRWMINNRAYSTGQQSRSCSLYDDEHTMLFNISGIIANVMMNVQYLSKSHSPYDDEHAMKFNI